MKNKSSIIWSHVWRHTVGFVATLIVTLALLTVLASMGFVQGYNSCQREVRLNTPLDRAQEKNEWLTTVY